MGRSAAPSPSPSAPASCSFRSARYAPELGERGTFADAGADGAVFPTAPAECGSILVPVLISRSHSVPYLECLRHLAARGYRVIAMADSRNASWVEGAYGDVFTVEKIPPELTAEMWTKLEPRVIDVAENGDDPAALARLLGCMGADYARSLYKWMKARAIELKPSLFIVDLFYNFCADICEELGIPYVATTSGLVPGMADAPWTRPLYTRRGETSTLGMSLGSRLWAATVEPARLICAALPSLKDAARARKELGVTAPRASVAAPSERFRGRLSLINTFFGHESARPLPPYVRLIGPVRSHGAATASTALQGEFKQFVESHGGDKARLVLLSFGQNCALTSERLKALLSALKRLLQRGVIDGAIWSISLTPEQWLVDAGFRQPGALPDAVLLTSWCPQKTLLEHPAVRVFVSHGGAESCGEAFYSATPVLSVPHFSDQPRNSVLIQEAGAGLVVYKCELTAEKVETALERLVTEPSFAAAARRMRALAVSCGRLSTERAADELEFVLHYGDGHLQPAGEKMGWAKRNNADLYASMGLLGLAGVAGVAALGLAGARALASRRGG